MGQSFSFYDFLNQYIDMNVFEEYLECENYFGLSNRCICRTEDYETFMLSGGVSYERVHLTTGPKARYKSNEYCLCVACYDLKLE